MAKNTPPQDTSPSTAELPARMRVHALAKLLGVTSKIVLAELAKLGTEVRSVQSSVDKVVAEQVRTALTEPTEPASVAPAPKTAPTAPAPKAALAAPLFLQPEAVTAPPRRRASRPSAAPESAADPGPHATTEIEPPTERPTEAPAEAPEEDDDAPKRRRRGRRGRGRGRGQHQDENGSGDENSAGEESAADPHGTSENSAARQIAATDSADSESTGPASDQRKAPQNKSDDGEDGNADDSKSEDAKSDDSDSDDTEQAAETSTGSRRRRRRRRKSGHDESPSDDDSGTTQGDDPPNTVVHERETRSRGKGGKSHAKDNGGDQVQGISGSTRLEAKRQRRRDGRDAGRRRPAILSESEFLARREAVNRKMVVRQRGEQTQVAVLEDDVLVEHFVTSSSSNAMVGNVYLGRVQNVLPSMEAAFIDVGRGRNGVLYAGEVDWDAAGLGGKSRKIEQALHSGDPVLAQVSKDPVGHKGARLTTQISLPGRFLVYVPGGGSTGISRKLPDTERKRLKEILKRIVPGDAGVIIRTASEGVSEEELVRDVVRLQAQWETISAKADEAKAAKSSSPVALYEEPDLLVKVVRDQFNEDFSALVVAGNQVSETVENYVQSVAPELMARVERHTGDVDVFTAYRIDEQLAKAMDRKVWLPSGGTLVIDRTEAMTVIDVNTGKFTGAGGNLEETVTRNNLEAAEEIVRQMRLRDIGGMIVVDFIDMVLENNRDLVLRRLTECLGRDRTRHQVSEVTSLGLVQMTRKRMGAGLIEEFSTPCEHCHGRGVLVQDEPVTPAESDNHGDSNRRSRRPRADSPSRQAVAKKEPVKEPWPAALIPASSAAAQAAAAKAVAPQPEPTPADSTPVVLETDAQEPDAQEPDAQQPDAREPVVESEAVPVPPVQPVSERSATSTGDAAAAPRRSRSRRSSRPAAAPEPASTAELAPAAAPVPAVEQPSPVAAPPAPVLARPRRRRAAARPAGPPLDDAAE